MLLGLVLVYKAQQPVWIEATGKKIWVQVKAFATQWGRGAPLVIGTFWAFLPCGLLYSALLVATLTGSALQGAAVMALFALGTSVSMMAGPWLWLKLAGRGQGNGQWGVRLAGLALAASSFWALWMGFAHDTAPWCATP
jgi:sulfite exporter TauE/SafE